MNTQSRTPRTDAMCECYCGPLCWIGDKQFIPATFARELEREIADSAAHADFMRLSKAHNELQAALAAAKNDLAHMRQRDVNQSFALGELSAQLSAANEACRKAGLDALYMRDDLLKQLLAATNGLSCKHQRTP